jgi:hypothetical protein
MCLRWCNLFQGWSLLALDLFFQRFGPKVECLQVELQNRPRKGRCNQTYIIVDACKGPNHFTLARQTCMLYLQLRLCVGWAFKPYDMDY